VVGKILLDKKLKVGTVESCTGGGIACAFMETPGSSAYFSGGLVTYSNEMKQRLANVSEDTLKTYGAVSQQTVEEMATGGLKVLNVDYCISVSGIAGPAGGTKEKPIGTVWISVASIEKVISVKYNFGSNREHNIQMSIFAA